MILVPEVKCVVAKFVLDFVLPHSLRLAIVELPLPCITTCVNPASNVMPWKIHAPIATAVDDSV